MATITTSANLKVTIGVAILLAAYQSQDDWILMLLSWEYQITLD